MAVYVVGTESGPYKIGIAADIPKRIAQLQTGNPYPLVLHRELTDWGVFERDMERVLHTVLERYRLGGEWFDCSLAKIDDAIETAKALIEPEIVAAAERERRARLGRRRREARAQQPPEQERH